MARWQPQRIPPLNFLDVHRVPVYTNCLFLWLKPTNTFAITNAYQLGQARLKYSSSHVKKDVIKNLRKFEEQLGGSFWFLTPA